MKRSIIMVHLDVFTQATTTQSGLGGEAKDFDDSFDLIMSSQSRMNNTTLNDSNISSKLFKDTNNSNYFNNEVNSTDCRGAVYSFALRDVLYNLSDHLPVTIQIQTTQSLYVEPYTLQQPIQFIDGNMITDVLKLRINSELLSNPTLNVYDNIGKLFKTINTKNSIYINENMSMFANGLYYIVLPQLNIKPLKFVIAH